MEQKIKQTTLNYMPIHKAKNCDYGRIGKIISVQCTMHSVHMPLKVYIHSFNLFILYTPRQLLM